MPPKVKITKEDIIKTALEMYREKGGASINARSIAASLGCSTQPVFSNFATMEELQQEVIAAAYEHYTKYLANEAESGKYPRYKAFGMAYIRFAKEEKELFKLLYMCDRSDEAISEGSELTDKMETIVHNNTGLEGSDAKLFHLEMWTYVHGIATMIATGYYNFDWELISKMLTDVYQGLKKQYDTEG